MCVLWGWLKINAYMHIIFSYQKQNPIKTGIGIKCEEQSL